jgi:hypothetical protein
MKTKGPANLAAFNICESKHSIISFLTTISPAAGTWCTIHGAGRTVTIQSSITQLSRRHSAVDNSKAVWPGGQLSPSEARLSDYSGGVSGSDAHRSIAAIVHEPGVP